MNMLHSDEPIKNFVVATDLDDYMAFVTASGLSGEHEFFCADPFGAARDVLTNAVQGLAARMLFTPAWQERHGSTVNDLTVSPHLSRAA